MANYADDLRLALNHLGAMVDLAEYHVQVIDDLAREEGLSREERAERTERARKANVAYALASAFHRDNAPQQANSEEAPHG